MKTKAIINGSEYLIDVDAAIKSGDLVKDKYTIGEYYQYISAHFPNQVEIYILTRNFYGMFLSCISSDGTGGRWNDPLPTKELVCATLEEWNKIVDLSESFGVFRQIDPNDIIINKL